MVYRCSGSGKLFLVTRVRAIYAHTTDRSRLPRLGQQRTVHHTWGTQEANHTCSFMTSGQSFPESCSVILPAFRSF